MTVRTFLVGSLLTAVSMGGIWLMITTQLDPLQAGLLGFILFFLTLFLAGASTAVVGGYAVRRIVAPRQLSAYAVRSALRQGILLSMLLIMLLILQLMRLYRWWLVIIMLVLMIATELIFVSYDAATHRKNTKTQE